MYDRPVMWLRTLGPLAAIVVVAGGLLACATAPKPADGLNSAGDGHDPVLHCGNMLELPPQQIVAAIEERARQVCSPGASAYGRRGEFRAVLRARDGREPMVNLEPSGTLNADDERCVQLAAADVRQSFIKAWGNSSRVWSQVTEDVAFSIALPGPVPIPAAPRMVDPESPR
jgi:hypothetical protein